MYVDGVDVYVNHPILALGSTEGLPSLSSGEELASRIRPGDRFQWGRRWFGAVGTTR